MSTNVARVILACHLATFYMILVDTKLLFTQHYVSSYLSTKNLIILVHGLLDSSDTFLSFSNTLHTALTECKIEHTIIGIDTPGHGRSPRSQLDYISCAEKVIETIETLQRTFTTAQIHLVGHSTGGKLCAAIALQRPALISSLALLDVMPLTFPEKSWGPIRESIKRIHDVPIGTLTSKAEVHKYLEAIRMSVKLRLLLSSSTICNDLGLSWNFDIEEIVRSLPAIETFPSCSHKSYPGNVLLIRADTKKSFYVQEKDLRLLHLLFPVALDIVAIPGSGHWLHSEVPEETAKHIALFYQSRFSHVLS